MRRAEISLQPLKGRSPIIMNSRVCKLLDGKIPTTTATTLRLPRGSRRSNLTEERTRSRRSNPYFSRRCWIISHNMSRGDLRRRKCARRREGTPHPSVPPSTRHPRSSRASPATRNHSGSLEADQGQGNGGLEAAARERVSVPKAQFLLISSMEGDRPRMPTLSGS